MGGRIPHPLHGQKNDARLQNRALQKLVPVHLFRINDMDILLLVFHGMDDYNRR